MAQGRGALPPKLYFRIGEVASLVGVEPHVLRYWEREFRSIRPTKSAKGQRVYSRRDVENLMRVRDLLYSEGFTIAGAKRKLQRGAEPEAERTAKTEVQAEANVEAKRESTPEAPHTNGAEATDLRQTLSALKSEIEAFLDELGG
ncbi:MAG TPA: MerR family transcriptional regulator [Polyangiaceae bacterium]